LKHASGYENIKLICSDNSTHVYDLQELEQSSGKTDRNFFGGLKLVEEELNLMTLVSVDV